jgi:hypothetical protein
VWSEPAAFCSLHSLCNRKHNTRWRSFWSLRPLQLRRHCPPVEHSALWSHGISVSKERACHSPCSFRMRKTAAHTGKHRTRPNLFLISPPSPQGGGRRGKAMSNPDHRLRVPPPAAGRIIAAPSSRQQYTLAALRGGAVVPPSTPLSLAFRSRKQSHQLQAPWLKLHPPVSSRSPRGKGGSLPGILPSESIRPSCPALLAQRELSHWHSSILALCMLVVGLEGPAVDDPGGERGICGDDVTVSVQAIEAQVCCADGVREA